MWFAQAPSTEETVLRVSREEAQIVDSTPYQAPRPQQCAKLTAFWSLFVAFGHYFKYFGDLGFVHVMAGRSATQKGRASEA